MHAAFTQQPSGARPSKISADGPAERPAPILNAKPVEHTTLTPRSLQRFLRHKLTSPEKRTVKRIQAQRSDLFTAVERPSSDLVKSRILQMLREDRGLAEGMAGADAYEQLAGWLVDESLAGRTAAEIVGLYLREAGALERPELSAPRVKAALRVLNEVLYGDDQDTLIPQGVREMRLEKRDGGLQIVGVLRAGADEAKVHAACRSALKAAGYDDVDVRLVNRR
jgi:hypothetical protein